MTNRVLSALAPLLFAAAVILMFWSFAPRGLSAQAPASKDNEELSRLCAADQADRQLDPRQIDWTVVSAHDRARLARTKELYNQNRLQTGTDFFNAALILQHGDLPEDFLLAHELCVVSIMKGESKARFLAAASEDRFLMNIGRPQRFGTQYRSDPANAPMKLYAVDPSVTDELRRELNVPTLAQAKAREAELNRKQ